MKENKFVTIIICGIYFLAFAIAGLVFYLPNRKGIAKDAIQDKISNEQTQQSENNTEQTAQSQANLPVPLSGKHPEMAMPIKEFVPREGKIAYITIDDGPCSSTPELLDVLDQIGVKATFFVSGQFGSSEQTIERLRQIDSRGHGIAVHSYSHKYQQIYSSVDAFLDDYKIMDDLIVQATGKRNAIYRFPGGSNNHFNENTRHQIIDEMNSRGLIFYDWNAYDGAFDGLNKDKQIAQAIDGCSRFNSAILLMHNAPNKDSLLETLPIIVQDLKNKGYQFEKLGASVAPVQFVK